MRQRKKHSPGPWLADRRCGAIVDNYGKEIVHIGDDASGIFTHDVDIALIETATELLAALVDLIPTERDPKTVLARIQQWEPAAVTRARAAIAKATGK